MTYYSQKSCHFGAIPLFDVGNSRVYGGRLSTLQEIVDWSLLISLDPHATTAYPGPLMAVNKWGAEVVDKRLLEAKGVPTLQMCWPDGGTLPLDREWWKLLLQNIRDLPIPKDAERAKVGIGCFGGHGRTGTVLSCLVGLTSIIEKDGDPVKWVRDHYCDEAVETTGQIRYVEIITGKTVKEFGSLNYVSGVGGNTVGFTQSFDNTTGTGSRKKDDGCCLSTHFCSTCPDDQRCEDCPKKEKPGEKLEGWDSVEPKGRV